MHIIKGGKNGSKNLLHKQRTSEPIFRLKCVDSDGNEWIMHYAPNNWKTEAGAKRWAKNHGYNIKGE